MGELRLRSEAPLIVVDADTSTAQSDLEAGADQWLPKPFVPGALRHRCFLPSEIPDRADNHLPTRSWKLST